MLVHNAGVSIPGHVAESNVDEWRATFDVNVFGPVALTLALLPALRRARGQVVFINSGCGAQRFAGHGLLLGQQVRAACVRRLAARRRTGAAGHHDLSGRTDTDMQRELVAFEGGEYDPTNFLRPETVAAAVANVVATPPDGHVHEVVLRPARR